MQRRPRRPMELLPRFPIQRARALFPILIKQVTAPRPQPRLSHQPALHRIPVRVIQLLDPLLRAPHIEIIKTPLPETPRCLHGCLGPQSHMIRITPSARLPPQTLRHTLLQDLHHRRRRARLRFRNQQTYMLRHHHVPNQPELIALPSRSQ